MIFEKFQNFEKFPKKYFSFSKWKFLSKKKELTKKSNYHFDVEFCQESIFGIHKCNGAVLKVQNNVWTILKYLKFFMVWKFSLVVYSIFPIAFKDQNTLITQKTCSAPQNFFPIENRVSKQFRKCSAGSFAIGTPLMPKIISGSSHLQNLTHVYVGQLAKLGRRYQGFLT